MDTTMIELRLFVHQRLFSAAEEILGEVEKTITLALQEVDANRPKDNVEGLRHQLDRLTEQPAVRLPGTISNMEHGERCGIQLLQENHVPSTPEESPEVPGPSNPSTDPDDTDRNHCLLGTEFKVLEIKEEQEQAGDEGPTLEAAFPFPEVGKFEQDQPELEISYEIQPDSSDCSAAGYERDNEEELVTSKGEQTTMQRTKNEKAALPHSNLSGKGLKVYIFCPFCDKGFLNMGAVVGHAYTHKQEKKCKICGKTCSSVRKLIKHFKICRKSLRCDKRSVTNVHLKTHMMVHGEGCGIQLLQENHVSPIPEENPEVPGPSRPSTDLDDTDWNHCLLGTEFKVPEEQEQAEDEDPTLEAVFPFPEVGMFEQDQPELEISYEIQPESERESQTVQQGRPHRNLSGKDLKDRSLCPFCGKGFLYIGSLIKHVKSHNRRRRNDCKNCGKTYQTQKVLIKHLKSCHSKSLFCDICSKVFSDSGHLRMHKKTHKCGEEFVCQECGKTFKRFEHLSVHVRTHSGEKPYQCDMCGKAFTQSQNLIIHKRTHSGERPYQCGQCDKRFTTSSQLKTHRVVHSGERPYPCDICGKHFQLREQMRRHKTIHTKVCTPATSGD